MARLRLVARLVFRRRRRSPYTYTLHTAGSSRSPFDAHMYITAQRAFAHITHTHTHSYRTIYIYISLHYHSKNESFTQSVYGSRFIRWAFSRFAHLSMSAHARRHRIVYVVNCYYNHRSNNSFMIGNGRPRGEPITLIYSYTGARIYIVNYNKCSNTDYLTSAPTWFAIQLVGFNNKLNFYLNGCISATTYLILLTHKCTLNA